MALRRRTNLAVLQVLGGEGERQSFGVENGLTAFLRLFRYSSW